MPDTPKPTHFNLFVGMAPVAASPSPRAPNIEITLGAGKDRPQGRLATIHTERTGLAGALAEGIRRAGSEVESWWSPHTFGGDRRSGDNWQGACAVPVDGDYYDAAGEHVAPPPELRERVDRLARAGSFPGNLYHGSTRGLRLVASLDAPIDARRQHAALSEAALVARDAWDVADATHRTAGAAAAVARADATTGLLARADDAYRALADAYEIIGLAYAAAVREVLRVEGLLADPPVAGAADGTPEARPRNGYWVDEAISTNRARLLYGPRATVGGVPRDFEVVVVREVPYSQVELRALPGYEIPSTAPPASATPTTCTAMETEGLEGRFEAWNKNHALDYPAPGTGTCPICHHNECFGRLADNAERWCCFSQNHGDDVGMQGEGGCHHGDALDIEAHRRGMSRWGVICEDDKAGIQPLLDKKRAEAEHRAAAAAERETLAPTPAASPPTGAQTERRRFKLVRACDVPEPGPIKFLVEDLWVEGAFGIVGAEPKAWKSFITLEMAIAVTTSGKAFGRYQAKQGKVLIFSAEGGGKNGLRRRLGAMCRAKGISIPDDIVIIDESVLRLDNDSDADGIVLAVEEMRPALVVLDPLRELHVGDENASDSIATLLRPLRRLQNEFGVACMLVHHMHKAPSDGKSARRSGQRLRGSSALHGATESAIYLEAKGEGVEKRVTLTVEHKDAQELPEPITLLLVDGFKVGEGGGKTVELKIVEAPTEEQELDKLLRERQAIRDKVIYAIDSAWKSGKPLRSQKDVVAMVKRNREMVNEVIKTLLEERVVVLTDGHAYRPRPVN